MTRPNGKLIDQIIDGIERQLTAGAVPGKSLSWMGLDLQGKLDRRLAPKPNRVRGHLSHTS